MKVLPALSFKKKDVRGYRETISRSQVALVHCGLRPHDLRGYRETICRSQVAPVHLG